ncbi:MAG: hypothetical protein P1P84_24580, partial [Deferrisomatales bacterium]|nr:hypothetical protein [Deferrisomatales bacterium]
MLEPDLVLHAQHVVVGRIFGALLGVDPEAVRLDLVTMAVKEPVDPVNSICKCTSYGAGKNLVR